MIGEPSPAERAKRAAAARALEEVRDGMVLGLGTGSTAGWFVELLAASGLRVTGVPTSRRTEAQAGGLGIPLTTLDAVGRLDLVVDGADEFDEALNLIKGGGGALLQEKIVAGASDRMIVISDPSKEVAALGAFPLPVEVARFGMGSTARLVAECLADHGYVGREIVVRGGRTPLSTDEGHHILDLHLGRIADPAALDIALNAVPGVIETGLFCGIAAQAIIGREDGSARIVSAT